MKLWPGTVVVTLLVAAGACVIAVSKAGGELTPYAMGALTGTLFACIVFPLVIAKITHLVSRRSSGAANIAFLIVVGLIAFGQVGQFLRGPRERAITDEMVAASRPDREHVQRQIDEQGYVEDLASVGERGARRLEEAGAKMSGAGAGVMKAGAVMTRRMTELGVPYNEAMKAFVEAGGIGAAGLTDAAAVRARLDVIGRLGSANDALLAYIKDLPAEAARQMRVAGVPEDRIALSVQGFLGGMNHSTVLAIRELDAEYVQAAQEHFGVLLQHEGKWSLDGDSFAAADDFPDEDIQRFIAAGERLDEIGRRQEELMAQLRASQAADE